MVKQIVFTKTFLVEFEEILAFVATFYSEDSAEAIQDMILQRVSLLNQFPYSGHVISEDGDNIIYRIIKGRYNIYYTVRGEFVRLVSIRDAKIDDRFIN